MPCCTGQRYSPLRAHFDGRHADKCRRIAAKDACRCAQQWDPCQLCRYQAEHADDAIPMPCGFQVRHPLPHPSCNLSHNSRSLRTKQDSVQAQCNWSLAFTCSCLRLRMHALLSRRRGGIKRPSSLPSIEPLYHPCLGLILALLVRPSNPASPRLFVVVGPLPLVLLAIIHVVGTTVGVHLEHAVLARTQPLELVQSPTLCRRIRSLDRWCLGAGGGARGSRCARFTPPSTGVRIGNGGGKVKVGRKGRG